MGIIKKLGLKPRRSTTALIDARSLLFKNFYRRTSNGQKRLGLKTFPQRRIVVRRRIGKPYHIDDWILNKSELTICSD
jgi:hypothetical protein